MTDAFALQIVTDVVRGGVLKMHVERDFSPDYRGLPRSLDEAEMAIINPHMPVLRVNEQLGFFGSSRRGCTRLPAGRIVAIHPVNPTLEKILTANNNQST